MRAALIVTFAPQVMSRPGERVPCPLGGPAAAPIET